MTMLKSLTAAAAFSALANAMAVQKRGVNFDYNNGGVKGVNLGGWFVLEPWITPSIFEAEGVNDGTVVDEWTLTAKLGYDEAYNRLSQHWATWITEADFYQIASFGLNHVRIPVGYWSIAPVEGDPYVQGALDYLDKAIGWARGAGLKVIVDLHGAPGSQNGFDNSGHYGSINWLSGDTYDQTLTALNTIASRYAGDTDVVTAIEVLNEPLGPDLDLSTVQQFYWDGYGNIRAGTPNTAVVIHDAFEDIDNYWNGFMNIDSGATNVILDTHDYQIFNDDQISLSPADHIGSACSQGSKVASTDKWLIVGEWTGAQTDCAKWLNGYGKGARYDGTLSGGSWYGSCDGKYAGTVEDLSDDDKKNLRMYIEAQMDAYEQHTGWVFWTWKTETAPEWHFQNLTLAGLIPQPLDSRQYQGQCNMYF